MKSSNELRKQAEFKILLRLARDGGYSAEDAFFMHGVFSLLRDGITEKEADEIFESTPKNKIHKDWK